MRLPSPSSNRELARMRSLQRFRRVSSPPSRCAALRVWSVAITVSGSALLGCAPAQPVTRAPAPASPQASAGSSENRSAPAPTSQIRWQTTTAPHVDLWLHGFALISEDTALVPLYRRGYRDSVGTVRRGSNVLTALDGNRSVLANRLAFSPHYLQAQFLPFEFGSWEELRVGAQRFLQFDGEPRRAPDQSAAAHVALFASVFSTPEDREWLRLFVSGLEDENSRWFAAEHKRLLVQRAPVIQAVAALWANTYRAKLERFLNNTGQRNGDLVLSVPLGGEGRTGNGRERQTVVAVGWPGRVQDATEAILVFAHEITGSLVSGVVTDNTSPAEKRDGLNDRYISAGQVRAGAMLLEKVAPDLVEPYMRYYLAQAGRRPTGALSEAFARAFALPKPVADGLLRQIEIVLGGI